MLYPKNESKKLDLELFKNPTSEYRGTPFWAWNTNLKKDELLWQIDRLYEMGFGGYHMHVRSGMNTEYLSRDFMDLISACVEKGKSKNMLSWLYDEDRWPSGAAGGIVTKDKRFRQKAVVIKFEKDESATDPITGYNEGRPYLLATFDVKLNGDGEIESYKRIAQSDEACGRKIYAYVITAKPSGWYNGQTYVDTLDKAAMKKFVDVTYEPYLERVGDEFGKSIPAIFTDEPQFKRVERLKFAKGEGSVGFPWTQTFDSSFCNDNGYSIVDKLPELVWNLQGGAPSAARYDYYNHASELFAEAFADQCGAWCKSHGISFTGHLMAEYSLVAQVSATGESMRSYRSFGIPGIDMLCDAVELTTAKQTQSVTHQYGKEGMLSELYGVTGWAFDFRGHKFQGDWQAALGVTVRVPHLSWVSMKGSAKRDYPASIHYQSAWYNKYSYVEDHFARLNTALTRGEPDVKIGVLHPVESCWLNMGPHDASSSYAATLENAFQNLTEYLLGSQLDFNFISESLLPQIYGGAEGGEIKVGKMAYRAVVIPPILTIRKTTVDALMAFIDAKGKVLFTGECPKCVDGRVSDYAKALYERAEKCNFTKIAITEALENVRDITLKNAATAQTPDNFLYAMRRDGDGKWLFITRFKKPGKTPGLIYDPDINAECKLNIKIKGTYVPTVYDTVSGDVKKVAYTAKDGYTSLSASLYASDSLLLRLDFADEGELTIPAESGRVCVRTIDFKEKVDYSISEPNILVLDMCRYSLDGENYSGKEEMLRIDSAIRRRFAWPSASGGDCQPWAIEEEKIDTYVNLKFEFESEVSAPCKLAFEEAEAVEFNGENIPVLREGWFVDKEIYTMKMPDVKKGKNTLIVKAPISKRLSLENMFLLGDFGVRVEGTCATLIERPAKLAFGSVTSQGLPFYGAAVTYELPLSLDAAADVSLCASLYSGAVIGVKLDGEDVGNIAYAPFEVMIPEVSAGSHKISLTLYATRVNNFGALHSCVNLRWKGPNMYYTKDREWSYEYNLEPVGIMKSPIIKIYSREG